MNLLLGVAVAFNLGLLSYYKYANFFVNEILVEGLGGASIGLAAMKTIALPIGISFYTFQALSYVIDVYRGWVFCTYNFVDFACYVTCFPQLIAGPIVRYKDIASQLVSRVVTFDKFALGVERFVCGLAKKVLIANTVAKAADGVFELPAESLGLVSSWFGAICYTLQIYYDFSGYSDMAIGLGLMFGFTFCENFNYPYISKSIREFWQRWHMSLSTWFRDYLYIPLGGNRGRPWRTYLNLWLVFVLCGLWHGASWNFIIWGAYYGVFLVLERGGGYKILDQINGVVCHLYTILVVVVGWVIFRAESVPHIQGYLLAMVGQGYNTVAISQFATTDVLAAMLVGCVLVAPWSRGENILSAYWENNVLLVSRYAGVMAAFVMSIASVASNTYNPFLYFRF